MAYAIEITLCGTNYGSLLESRWPI